jgi:hypothetical protein
MLNTGHTRMGISALSPSTASAENVTTSRPLAPPLQQAERHVAEGRERVARQRELVERLEREGPEKLLPGARETLAEMEGLQRNAERHFEWLCAMYKRLGNPTDRD